MNDKKVKAKTKTKAELFPAMKSRVGGSVTVDEDGKRTKTKPKKASKKPVNKSEKDKENVD